MEDDTPRWQILLNRDYIAAVQLGDTERAAEKRAELEASNLSIPEVPGTPA
jgi:hypothetical protein